MNIGCIMYIYWCTVYSTNCIITSNLQRSICTFLCSIIICFASFCFACDSFLLSPTSLFSSFLFVLFYFLFFLYVYKFTNQKCMIYGRGGDFWWCDFLLLYICKIDNLQILRSWRYVFIKRAVRTGCVKCFIEESQNNRCDI